MRLYQARGGQSTAASGTETALVITAPSDCVVEIRRIRVSQNTHNSSEGYGLTVQRATAAGSGGAAVTAQPFEPSDAATSATVASGPTTEPTYTAGAIVADCNWNAVVGRDIVWAPGEGPKLAPTNILGIFVTSPAGATTFTPSVEIEFAEIG